jgi:hypothetical protein
MIQLFHEIKRHSPAVVYLPNIDEWWQSLTESMRAVFQGILRNLHHQNQVIIVATAEAPAFELADDLKTIFLSRSFVDDTSSSMDMFGRKVMDLVPPTKVTLGKIL